jgi:hypothetical protein
LRRVVTSVRLGNGRGTIMKLTIEIDLDNDAFTGRQSEECLCILSELANNDDFIFMIEDGERYKVTLRDSNGNSVGTAYVVEG